MSHLCQKTIKKLKIISCGLKSNCYKSFIDVSNEFLILIFLGHTKSAHGYLMSKIKVQKYSMNANNRWKKFDIQVTLRNYRERKWETKKVVKFLEDIGLFDDVYKYNGEDAYKKE